jgi:hypothetical protein
MNTVKLSTLKVGDCGRLKGKRFIVTDRMPEDRSSGSTTIRWEGGPEQEFFTDSPLCQDPDVTPLGRGSLKVSIEFPAK